MTLGPLHVNARLTFVGTATAATGGRDDWDTVEGVEPTGAGTMKWEGDEPAYYREEVDDTNPAGVLVRRTLWIQTTAARTAGIDTDDIITFTGPDGTEHTATAIAVAYSDAAEQYGTPIVSERIATTRLELQPA